MKALSLVEGQNGRRYAAGIGHGTHGRCVGINVVVINGDKARATAHGTNPDVVIEEPLPNPEFITMGWAKELADKLARRLIEAKRQGA